MFKHIRLFSVNVTVLFVLAYAIGAFLFVPLRINAATPEEECLKAAKEDIKPDLVESTLITTAAQCDLGVQKKTHQNLGPTVGAPVGTVCCVKLKPPGISGPGQFSTESTQQTLGSPTTL